jgi:thiol-disulfide isomerase/thioredoxin
MKVKNILSIIVVLVLCLICYVGTCKIIGYPLFSFRGESKFLTPVVTNHEGNLLPRIEMLMSDSVTHLNIEKLPGGKPIVLFYFSPHCPYCRAEIDDITKNISQLKGIEFYLLTPYPYSDMKAFYDEYKFDKYPSIKVGIDYQFEFGAYFKTELVPYLAIYNSKRMLRSAFQGNITSEQIKAVAME